MPLLIFYEKCLGLGLWCLTPRSTILFNLFNTLIFKLTGWHGSMADVYKNTIIS